MQAIVPGPSDDDLLRLMDVDPLPLPGKKLETVVRDERILRMQTHP